MNNIGISAIQRCENNTKGLGIKNNFLKIARGTELNNTDLENTNIFINVDVIYLNILNMKILITLHVQQYFYLLCKNSRVQTRINSGWWIGKAKCSAQISVVRISYIARLYLSKCFGFIKRL